MRNRRAYIVPIVEGQGEELAVKTLLRRLCTAYAANVGLGINAPIRVKASSFVKDGEYFHKYVNLAAAKAKQENGVVFIFLDCEDACPAEMGPTLLKRAMETRNDVPYQVVLAHREYETWFLEAIESLRGLNGLPACVERPDKCEGIRGAKEWLGKQMKQKYDPIIHQEIFTSKMDLEMASRNPSFNRLIRIMRTIAAVA